MRFSEQHEHASTGGLLTAVQAAEYLGISVRHLRTMQAAGRICCVRIGARVLYTRADLNAFIERSRVVAS